MAMIESIGHFLLRDTPSNDPISTMSIEKRFLPEVILKIREKLLLLGVR